MDNLKSIFRSISHLVRQSSDLQHRYSYARSLMHIYAKSSFYEISTKCNLNCKGCYFKSDSIPQRAKARYTEWEKLFRAEQQRGIRIGSFFGAEPAFHQELLALGAQYIPFGNIGSNGSIHIDQDIAMRIHISCWGLPDTEEKLRGRSYILKALKTYAGDERVIICYTINAKNIDDTPKVVSFCEDNGLPVTFNMFSPMEKSLPSTVNHKNRDPLAFENYSLAKTRNVVDELIDRYPKTVFYTHNYNKWITENGPRYILEKKSGIAVNCGSRLTRDYRYYTVDARRRTGVKCVHSSISCEECRIYGAGFSTWILPLKIQPITLESFSEWLNHMEMFGRIFFTPHDAKKISEGCFAHDS